jgi:hydrogenase expression/formation protein HypC
MCLGIPMQIDAIEGYTARCSAKGVSREVSTFLMQGEPLEAGDFVIVHVGYAIQKVTPQEAQSTWELLDEMLALEEQEAQQAQAGP